MSWSKTIMMPINWYFDQNMDFLEVVRDQEQRGITALFLGKTENVQWIWAGNYLKIDYKDNAGKHMDTHPHVANVIKRLAESNLTAKHQREILQGCEHYAALEYLECVQQNEKINQLITGDIGSDEYFGF